MGTVLYYKFTQHKYLKRELLSTGDAELIEVQFLHCIILSRYLRLTGEEYRTQIKTHFGGVGRMERVGMSLGKPLCGFASNYENKSGGKRCGGYHLSSLGTGLPIERCNIPTLLLFVCIIIQYLFNYLRESLV